MQCQTKRHASSRNFCHRRQFRCRAREPIYESFARDLHIVAASRRMPTALGRQFARGAFAPRREVGEIPTRTRRCNERINRPIECHCPGDCLDGKVIGSRVLSQKTGPGAAVRRTCVGLRITVLAIWTGRNWLSPAVSACRLFSHVESGACWLLPSRVRCERACRADEH